jgi:hypothetical protein
VNVLVTADAVTLVAGVFAMKRMIDLSQFNTTDDSLTSLQGDYRNANQANDITHACIRVIRYSSIVERLQLFIRRDDLLAKQPFT